MSEIHYEIRGKDISALTQHQLQYSDTFKKGLRRHQVILPLILIAVALVSWGMYNDPVSAAVLAILGAVWAIISPTYMRWNIARQVKKMYTKDVWKSMLGKHQLKATPTALVDTSPKGESKVPWDELLRVEGTKKYVFIFFDIDTAQIIPRDTIAKGDLHEFVRMADEKIEEAEKFAERLRKNKK